MAENEEQKKRKLPPSDSENLVEPVPATRECNDGNGTTQTDPQTPGSSDKKPFRIQHVGDVDVALRGTAVDQTDVQGFWAYLRQRTDAIRFDEYADYIKSVLCVGSSPPASPPMDGVIASLSGTTRVTGVDTYQLLRAATEAFLLVRCGSLTDRNAINGTDFPKSRFGGATMTAGELNDKLGRYVGTGSIPYIDRIVGGFDTGGTFCDDIDAKVLQPCFIELIWSYWHEEAALVQSINAISLRFQNKRAPGDLDVLANLETHPLRPLANVLWGYVQDEDHRLTVARRAYEYEHQYGLSLVGRAVPKYAPADRRSQFLLAFHTLLHQAAIFYDRSANLTVRADAFPLLNALREVHLVLAEGAHNQFRELPWTARVEMLIQQWLLSRREVREFVGGRPAVPYAEDWMRTVDALRRLMGWGDTSITHFHDLAVTGEKIVLAVRFGDWSNTDLTESDAAGWAVFWRPEIQRYIHAYQAVTGVDLSATTQITNRKIDATPPAVLLQQQRAIRQRNRP